MKKEQKVFYYSDPLNDEFSSAKIETKTIDENYRYVRINTFLGKLSRLFWYHIVFRPFGFLRLKLKFHHKIIGKEKLKETRKNAYFMYGNHTLEFDDAFVFQYFDHKEKFVITHANNVSMKFLGRITPCLGALPLPANMKAYKNFMNAIDYHISHKHPIIIYPEAHIWPFYTGIRPFKDTSFHYPIKQGVLAYCFTNTYQRRGKNKFKIVTYIDGPFKSDNKEELRNMIYNQMVERSKMNNIEINKYIYREKEND